MTGSTLRISRKTLFQGLEIFTLASQYIFSLMRFLSSNLEIYKFNTLVHNINTRCKLKLHKPVTRLTVYQRSVCYNSMHIYNKLPDDLAKLVSNKKCFLLQLKKYLTSPFIWWKSNWMHDRPMMWGTVCQCLYINLLYCIYTL
jgi:hypothetical protein